MNDPILEAAVELHKAIMEDGGGLPPEVVTAMDEIMKILTLAATAASTDADIVARMVARFEPTDVP